MGEITSLAIIAACVAGVVWAARARHAELTAAGLPYWRPVYIAILGASVTGLIGLVALHWWLAATGPAPVQ